MTNKTANEIIAESQDFQKKVKFLFGTGTGKEVLEYLKHIHVDGQLFCDTQRETDFALGQRQVVMDLINIVKGAQ